MTPKPTSADDVRDRVALLKTDRKLYELDLQIAETQLNEAKERFDLATNAPGQVARSEVIGLKLAVQRAALEVEKKRVQLEAKALEIQQAEKHLTALPPAASITKPVTNVVGEVAFAQPMSDDLRKLRQEQVKAAEAVLVEIELRMKAGASNDSAETVVLWSKRLCDAQSELAPAERPKHAADHLARVRKVEEKIAERIKVGAIRPDEVGTIQYHRLEAEVMVRQADGLKSSAPQLRRTGANGGVLSQPAGFRGGVTGIENVNGEVLVRFRHGPGAGIRVNDVLAVVRYDTASSEGRFVGMIRVQRVGESVSVAESVGQFIRSGDNSDAPKEGDSLMSRVTSW